MRQSLHSLYLALLQFDSIVGLLPTQERALEGERLLLLAEPGLAVLPDSVRVQLFLGYLY